MTTSLDRGHGERDDASGGAALVDDVRVLMDRYCRARLAGYAGGAEAAEDIAREVGLDTVDALRRSEDQGARFAALVFASASHKVAEAQRRLERHPGSAARPE